MHFLGLLGEFRDSRIQTSRFESRILESTIIRFESHESNDKLSGGRSTATLAAKVEGKNYYTLKPSAIKNDGVIKFLILPLKNESLDKISGEAHPYVLTISPRLSEDFSNPSTGT